MQKPRGADDQVSRGRGSHILARIVTALVLAPIVLAATFWSNPIVFYGLTLLVVLVACMEWSNLMDAWPPFLALLIAGFFGGALVTHSAISPAHFLILELIASVCYAAGIFWNLRMAQKKLKVGILGGLSGIWITIPLANLAIIQGSFHLLKFAEFAPLALLVLLPVWAGDSAGYFVGKSIGKTPLLPKISPKKTKEGAIAHLICALFIGVACSILMHVGNLLQFGTTRASGAATSSGLTLSIVIGVLVGLVAGVASIGGDLLESALKRSVEVKDSGQILPGHGGILDRIDGLLLACPAVGLVLAIFVIILRGHSHA